MRSVGVIFFFAFLVAVLACSATPPPPGAPASGGGSPSAGAPAAGASAASAPASASGSPDQDVVDAYEYMLGRWLLMREETLDFKNGFRWNEVVHRPRPGATTSNPSLDVTLSEAWMYIDESSCTLIELPPITGRYYTMQFSNGWGEVTDNVNERRNPHHPYGKFAMCVQGATLSFPTEVRRLNLPSRRSHVVIRIEVGADPDAAYALQKQIKMKPTGAPQLPKAAPMQFTNDKLPGAEGFDRTEEILAADPDLAEGMEEIQLKVRAAARAAANPAQRARIENLIRERAIPAFLAEAGKVGMEMNGWIHPRLAGAFGKDYVARSVVNFTAPWANNPRESAFFVADDLDGSATYIEIFANTALPRTRARYSWSVAALDAEKHRVIPNAPKRYRLSKESPLKYGNDNSLTLAFAPSLPEGVPESNWLPTPAGKRYSLTYRFYGPSRDVVGGQYAPPPLAKK